MDAIPEGPQGLTPDDQVNNVAAWAHRYLAKKHASLFPVTTRAALHVLLVKAFEGVFEGMEIFAPNVLVNENGAECFQIKVRDKLIEMLESGTFQPFVFSSIDDPDTVHHILFVVREQDVGGEQQEAAPTMPLFPTTGIAEA